MGYYESTAELLIHQRAVTKWHIAVTRVGVNLGFTGQLEYLSWTSPGPLTAQGHSLADGGRAIQALAINV